MEFPVQSFSGTLPMQGREGAAFGTSKCTKTSTWFCRNCRKLKNSVETIANEKGMRYTIAIKVGNVSNALEETCNRKNRRKEL